MAEVLPADSNTESFTPAGVSAVQRTHLAPWTVGLLRPGNSDAASNLFVWHDLMSRVQCLQTNSQMGQDTIREQSFLLSTQKPSLSVKGSSMIISRLNNCLRNFKSQIIQSIQGTWRWFPCCPHCLPPTPLLRKGNCVHQLQCVLEALGHHSFCSSDALYKWRLETWLGFRS